MDQEEKPVLLKEDGTPFKPTRCSLGFGRGVLDRYLPLEIQLNLKEGHVDIPVSGNARPAHITKVR